MCAQSIKCRLVQRTGVPARGAGEAGVWVPGAGAGGDAVGCFEELAVVEGAPQGAVAVVVVAAAEREGGGGGCLRWGGGGGVGGCFVAIVVVAIVFLVLLAAVKARLRSRGGAFGRRGR